MPTSDAHSNVVWNTETGERMRFYTYVVQWEGPTFGPDRSATVVLSDDSVLASGWTARVQAHHPGTRLSHTPQGFQNAVDTLRRVLTAESQKAADHSWAARYLPQDAAPTAQQLATAAVAESLRAGPSAFPMPVRILYANHHSQEVRTLSGDRIMPVTPLGPVTQLDPPLGSYSTFMNRPPSIHIRQYPSGSITGGPTIINVLMTGKSAPGSIWWESVQGQVSAVLKGFIQDHPGYVSPVQLKSYLESTIPPGSWTSLSVSDGHTSETRGIENPGFVWADFDVGREKVYVFRGSPATQPVTRDFSLQSTAQ